MAESTYLLDLVREAVERLGGRATYKQIIEEVQKDRPDAAAHTLRSHIIMLSVNQPSRIHSPQNKKPRAADHERYDALFSISPGQVELYDPARHGQWEIRQEGDHTVVVDPEGNMVRTSTHQGDGPQACVVRAGTHNKHATKFEELGKIAIGYNPAGDLSNMTTEQIATHSAQVYAGESAGTIGARTGVLKAFALGIKTGDIVLTPTETHSEVLVGHVTGDYDYAPEPLMANFRHNRSVKWIGRVARNSLPQATQKGLDAPRTVYAASGADELLAMFGAVGGQTPSSARWWIFQGNPAIWDIRRAVNDFAATDFSVRRYKDDVKAGAIAFMWESGPNGGVVGLAEVLEDPVERPHRPDQYQVDNDDSSLKGIHPRCDIKILQALDPPISRDEIKAHPGLENLAILRFSQGTNFPVTPDEAQILQALVDARKPKTSATKDPLAPLKWTNAWWVNQGATYSQERDGGYVWAPNSAKEGGAAKKHWRALTGMRKGDLIFHYARVAIRALSRVTQIAEVTDRPSELPLTEWEARGWQVKTDYFELDKPIPLADIPHEWRVAENGPFDVNGAVKQQYANHLSETFVNQVIRRFGDRLRNSTPDDGDEIEMAPTELIELIKRRKNVVFYGPPGTGKTYQALRLAQEWERIHGDDSVRKVTFHPSYGYEDFVQGFRPKPDQPGEFALQPGILLRICDDAAKAPDRDFLLLIDEINRGDVARVFGELITYIEADKRGIPFDLAQDDRTQYEIPPNVYFLGTMNTADKSVSLLDVALRRRFAFREFRADPEAFTRVQGWRDSVQELDLGELLDVLNQRLLAEGVEVDRAIGHALLSIPTHAPNPTAALKERIEYDIAPLVAEYSYLDRGRIARILPGLVDDQGRFLSDLSDDAVIAHLKSLLAGEASAPQLPSPDLGTELELEARQTELEQ